MDLRRLLLFMRVVELGGITRAAESLGIAQPALSQHMRVLEQGLGTKLLIRTRQGAKPTEAGWVAYQSAKSLARETDRVRARVRTTAGAPVGRVAVGVAPHSPARGLIRPLLRAARERFPGIVPRITENFEGKLAADLRDGIIDMALFHDIAPLPGFFHIPVLEEPLALIGRASLLARGDIAPAALAAIAAGVPLVLPGPSHAIRRMIDTLYAAERGRPDLVAEIESFETLAGAVRHGFGATILPLSVARSLAAEELSEPDDWGIRPFGPAGMVVRLSLATLAGAARSDAAAAIHELLAALAATLSPPPVTEPAMPAVARQATGRPPGRPRRSR